MKAYKWEILELAEVRWNGQGEHLTPYENFYFKEEGQPHESGVGILLSKNLRKSLISWKSVSDRIILARVYTQYRKINFNQCYAPTEPSALEEKQAFYEQLEYTNKISKAISIVMGDT